MKMALSPQLQERAEEFGITFKLDVCGLYKVMGAYGLLTLFMLSVPIFET